MEGGRVVWRGTSLEEVAWVAGGALVLFISPREVEEEEVEEPPGRFIFLNSSVNLMLMVRSRLEREVVSVKSAVNKSVVRSLLVSVLEESKVAN